MKDLQEGVRMTLVGTEFVSMIGACGLIGWFLDRQFGSQPWVMLGMTFAGFFWGVVKISRMLNESSAKQKSGGKEIK